MRISDWSSDVCCSDLHPHGPIAARASEAASNQGMFWPWLDFVFTRQHALEREDLIGYAVGLGLDGDRFIADLDSPAVIERVERDLASARASGAHVPTTFFVEGRRHRKSGGWGTGGSV